LGIEKFGGWNEREGNSALGGGITATESKVAERLTKKKKKKMMKGVKKNS